MIDIEVARDVLEWGLRMRTEIDDLDVKILPGSTDKQISFYILIDGVQYLGGVSPGSPEDLRRTIMELIVDLGDYIKAFEFLRKVARSPAFKGGSRHVIEMITEGFKQHDQWEAARTSHGTPER